MDIHLVAGFLGSGKTTAIIAAARRLALEGRRVGVVTNDQGRALVDSAFVRSAGLPSMEVTGGCFCCNFDDFARVILALGRRSRPDVIFAESVGSCADLVATVVKPLAAGARAAGRLRSLSVFADVRLLARWLEGRPLPFGENVSYIFAQQLEEAGTVVVNKADLFAEPAARAIHEQASRRFPNKSVLLHSSLRDEDSGAWLRLIGGDPGSPLPTASLSIDYDRYGAGEAELAWVDARITLACAAAGARAAVAALLGALTAALGGRDAPLGHLKVFVECEGVSFKLSVTAADPRPPEVPELAGTRVSLLINARAQAASGDLRRRVRGALAAAAAEQRFDYEVGEEAAFHPGPPRPQHRIP